jgi:hypothetical protein
MGPRLLDAHGGVCVDIMPSGEERQIIIITGQRNFLGTPFSWREIFVFFLIAIPRTSPTEIVAE